MLLLDGKLKTKIENAYDHAWEFIHYHDRLCGEGSDLGDDEITILAKEKVIYNMRDYDLINIDLPLRSQKKLEEIIKHYIRML